MKIRYSIVTRFALFFTGLIIFSILLTGYLVFRKASHVIVTYSQERIMHTSEMAEQAFFALLYEVGNDIAVIASSPTLINYVNDPSEETTNNLDHLFRITLENKPSYFQIRLIGIENNGKEIIRFDKHEERIFSPDTLQQKGTTDYFQETVKLRKGEFYFSEVNLNEEYGVISNPPTPTVRAASPVFDMAGNILGALVINVDLSDFYKTLKRISGSESQLFLIDRDGQYLYTPQTEKQFALQRKKNYRFFEDFSISRDTIIGHERYFGELLDRKKSTYLSDIRQLAYFQGRQKVYLVSLMEQNVLLQSARAVRSESIQILLWVCTLATLIALLFVNLFSKKINQVTKAIANYDKGITDKLELPTERKDEIGVLANTFTKMKSSIDRNLKELNAALTKEKHAKKQRDEFLQNMSHEMRTPLNTILGLTELLRKQSPNSAALPLINSLERSADNLAGLIYDVLDHQKLVEGKLQLIKRPTNIAELLKNIHSNYEYEALQKSLVFQLTIDEKLERRTYATDPLRLSQIVTNLVVNAIKYTPNGKVELFAKTISGKEEILEIRVKDTGIGILPTNIAKINERFFREKEDISGRYGGYGLGLSIVKQMTELFGGTLKAVSKKDKGSEFSVLIPIVPVFLTNDQNKKTGDMPLLPQLGNQYNILYIEDDASSVELMKYVLNDTCISFHHADNVIKASEILNTRKLSLVISDLMLENKGVGVVLSDWVTSEKIDCPLLLVSASEPETMKQISDLYFQKPFKLDHFKDLVYRILGANELNAPDFSSIYNNYDHESAKISNVLRLLREEFVTYLNRIEMAAASKDQKEWDAILHKLIAHIRTLRLTQLLNLLPNNIADLKKEDLNAITSAFAYYLCCIRCEERLNSRA